MKVALLHYHLKTGGVTTVVKQQVRALQGKCEMLVLTGDAAKTQLACPVIEIPEIAYDQPDKAFSPPEAIVDRILKSISQVWPGGCDILHIHNPTLAKNRYLLTCIHQLQVRGISLLLQIHDFAEDGRPQAYSREPYPRDCHYGVINARDAQILVSAGLNPKGVHLIPNAVESLPMDAKIKLESCVVYPVRAIRRKNIGEAILLSLYLRAGRRLHISQPPTSARDLPVYEDWQLYVKKHGLRVRFGTGLQYGFPALVAAADCMVTTSITEGFGFSFLEPWTVGKNLYGRRLDDICADFEKRGLCLDALYDRLAVPLTWLDVNGFIQDWHAAALGVKASYGRGPEPERLDAHIDRIQKEGLVDFGILSETYQRQVLDYVRTNPDAKKQLLALNPKILGLEPSEKVTAGIEKNRRIVQNDYDLDSYGERLSNVYTQVARRTLRHQIDKTVLLDAFLDLNRFSLLKWGPYAA